MASPAVDLIRLLDISPERMSIHCYPYDLALAPGPPSTPQHLLDSFGGYRPNESGVHWAELADVRLLIEPGADGVVYLDDHRVVWETTRFLRPAASDSPLLRGRDLLPATQTRTVAHLDSATVTFDPGWMNYYHWLVQTLPMLYHASIELGLSDTVLPEWPKDEGRAIRPAFAELTRDRSLRSCGIGSPPTPLHPGLYSVELLRLPVSTHGVGREVFSSVLGLQLARQIRSAVVGPTSALGRDRIFIDRPATPNPRRFGEHECQALRDLARATGHRSVRLEELPFEDQVRLFAGAKSVLGAHGSGLANIIFGTDLSVVEYVNPINDEPRIRNHFQFLAEQLGHRHQTFDRRTLLGAFDQLVQALAPRD